MQVYRYTAAVVYDGYGVIGIDEGFSVGCMAYKGLVNEVVHDFVSRWLQAFYSGMATLPGRAFSHGF